MGKTQPVVVLGTVREVRARLEAQLVVVGDIWFPTRREMQVWHQSGSDFYVKWTRAGGYEIGPRLETVPASRFAPALIGRFESLQDGSTRLAWRMGFPRFTRWLVWGFVAFNLVWTARVSWELYQGVTHAGWLGASLVTLISMAAGSAVAFWWGRGELNRRLPSLLAALQDVDVVEGEDWG